MSSDAIDDRDDAGDAIVSEIWCQDVGGVEMSNVGEVKLRLSWGCHVPPHFSPSSFFLVSSFLLFFSSRPMMFINI